MFEILIGAGIALLSVIIGYAAGTSSRTGKPIRFPRIRREMPDDTPQYKPHSPGTL